jgi:predicted metal-binding protein
VRDPAGDPDDLVAAIVAATRRWDAEGDGRVAIAIELPTGLDYGQLARSPPGSTATRGAASRPASRWSW